MPSVTGPVSAGSELVRTLVVRAETQFTLSAGAIAAIVLGVLVFAESIILWVMYRRNRGGSGNRGGGGRIW